MLNIPALQGNIDLDELYLTLRVFEYTLILEMWYWFCCGWLDMPLWSSPGDTDVIVCHRGHACARGHATVPAGIVDMTQFITGLADDRPSMRMINHPTRNKYCTFSQRVNFNFPWCNFLINLYKHSTNTQLYGKTIFSKKIEKLTELLRIRSTKNSNDFSLFYVSISYLIISILS